MSLTIVPNHAMSAWVEQMDAHYRVFGPTRRKDSFVFSEVHSFDAIELDYPTTILPPKKAILPQRETLLRFENKDGLRIDTTIDYPPTVLLGVHTCDLHAFDLLDHAYLGNYPDEHYWIRRNATTLVSIDCTQACSEHSFCKSMGTLSIPEKFDLHLTDLGDSYAAEVGSEKGQALLGLLQTSEPVKETHYQRLQAVLNKKWNNFHYKLDFDVSELPSLLSLSYQSRIWEELSVRCLACGTCNMVCPTCMCFDVEDKATFDLSAGERIRVWDSCQLNRFAIVAGDHNFRDNRADRIRHRFMHKGKYQTEAFGVVGCVGCGRCAEQCLAGITPIDVFNELHKRRVRAARMHEEVQA